MGDGRQWVVERVGAGRRDKEAVKEPQGPRGPLAADRMVGTFPWHPGERRCSSRSGAGSVRQGGVFWAACGARGRGEGGCIAGRLPGVNTRGTRLWLSPGDTGGASRGPGAGGPKSCRVPAGSRGTHTQGDRTECHKDEGLKGLGETL